MPKLSKTQHSEIIQKYLTGEYTMCELGRQYGVYQSSVRRILIRNNVKLNNDLQSIKRKYTLDQSWLDIIDTEAKAYFLGFMYADGYNNVARNAIIISLQEQDKEILEKFSTLFKSNRPLSFKKKSRIGWQNQFAFTVSSEKISTRLVELGCPQAKTFLIKFPTNQQVPHHLIRHFMRGYFDGDGSFSFWKSSKKEYLRACSSIIGTVDFCESLKDILTKEINLKGFFERKDCDNRIIALRYSSRKQVTKLVNWLYSDCEIFLSRKYKKMLEYNLLIESNQARKDSTDYSGT